MSYKWKKFVRCCCCCSWCCFCCCFVFLLLICVVVHPAFNCAPHLIWLGCRCMCLKQKWGKKDEKAATATAAVTKTTQPSSLFVNSIGTEMKLKQYANTINWLIQFLVVFHLSFTSAATVTVTLAKCSSQNTMTRLGDQKSDVVGSVGRQRIAMRKSFWMLKLRYFQSAFLSVVRFDSWGKTLLFFKFLKYLFKSLHLFSWCSSLKLC